MQRLKILRDKLDFICWFFDLTTAPFAEIRRKIETGESPYQSTISPEDDPESPFVNEGIDAHYALQLQGQLCLNLLQRSLLEYLDETVKLSRRKAPSKKDNWFKNYKEWFVAEGFDWSASTACLSVIEEMTEARNRVQHGSPGDSHTLIKQQDRGYCDRFPNAKFQNDFEAQIFGNFGPQLHSIELMKEKLQGAVEEILSFSTFIEEHLPDSMRYWQGSCSVLRRRPCRDNDQQDRAESSERTCPYSLGD